MQIVCHAGIVVVVVVNFIKHQNRAITGDDLSPQEQRHRTNSHGIGDNDIKQKHITSMSHETDL